MAKHDRIYDDIAVQEAKNALGLFEEATDLRPYIKEKLRIKTTGKGKNKKSEAYFDNEKEKFSR